MSFTRANPGGYVTGDVITATQINSIDLDKSRAIDGTAGGTYTPSAAIVFNGEGIETGKVGTFTSGADFTPEFGLLNWTASLTDTVGYPTVQASSDGAYFDGEWWIVGDGADDLVVSLNDGNTWTDGTSGAAPVCIASDEADVVVMGQASANIRRYTRGGGFANIVAPGAPTEISGIKFITGASPNGKFVCVGVVGAPTPYAATSSDSGATWSDRTAALPAGFAALSLRALAAKSSGIVVAAVGSAHTKLAVSADYGVTWAESTTTLTSDAYVLAYNTARAEFMAVGIAAFKVYTSTDGMVWTLKTTLVNADDLGGDDYHTLAPYGTAWVMSGGLTTATDADTVVRYSLDGGVSWNIVRIGSGVQIGCCFADIAGKRVIAVADDGIPYRCMRRAA